MSYIGRGLQSGAFRQLDDISSGFDGSDTTHTMQVNSTNVTVGDVNQILLSLGGVIQKPGTDFTVSSSTLTFTTAPAANTSFFAILLGSDNGGTVTPTDKSVTVGKIDINGGELFLDADDDTSITADTDDQIDFKLGGTDGLSLTASTATFTGGITANGNIVLTDGDDIIANTSDGSDNATIAIAGGGANSDGRGGRIRLNGNEVSSVGGTVDIGAGNVSTGQVTFLTGATTRMTISADGEVTKPSQPMASARPTNSVADITGDGTLAYLGNSIGATERFDVGGCFSNDGMLFIAPVTGKYLLCGQFTFSGLASNHTASYFALVTSNQTYYPLYGAELDTVSYLGTFGTAFSIIADMDANDSAQLAVQVYGGSKVVDATTATFLTGMLLA